MRDTHEPRSEFADKLEWQIGLEVRRRNRAVHDVPRWARWSPVKAASVVAGLMLLSMGIGAAAVVVAYEAQGSERRDQLAAGVEQRVALALQRLDLVTKELQTIQQRVEMGLATKAEALDGSAKVNEARAQLKAVELQVEEIRLTGREPRTDISAPPVSGRDFVAERLRNELGALQASVDVERTRVQGVETRFQIGMAGSVEVDASRAKMQELEAAVGAVQKKIDVRQKFLVGLISAAGAELRALEAEAEQRKRTLEPKLELARKEVDRVAARVRVGLAQQSDLTEANLRRLELETELTKAALDLTLVRQQIEQHKEGAN